MKADDFHQKQKDFLAKEAELGRLSHAYLFFGEAGTGKEKMADWFIGELQRSAGRSWDFQVWHVHPEHSKSGERATIGIDQMREVKGRTDLRFSEKGRQVVVVHRAHLMNYYAQDALLKVLEEPRNQTIFILLADHRQALRPTIVSRCQSVHFFPLSVSRSVEWLLAQGVSREQATTIALLGQGRLDFMAELKDNPKTVQKRMEEWAELRDLLGKPLAERFRFAEKKAKDKDLGSMLQRWLGYWRMLFLAASLGLKIGPEWKTKGSLAEMAGIIEKLEEVESSFRAISLNKRLALEQILISFDYV